VRATILGWSAVSGLVLGGIVGLMVFAVVIVSGELVPGVARLVGRVRLVMVLFSFVVLPLAGTVLGWLEGRLKLR
jgi:hypothetical protein